MDRLGETTRLLERLIAFSTVSNAGNLDLVDFVRAYLATAGVRETRVVPDESGRKAGLWATIGPDRPDGIVLSAHSDVVPVEDQPWTGDPFRLAERDGRLYGRGTTDMKGFLACALALAPVAARRRLARPIHIVVSYDEEIGCVGVRTLLEALRASGFNAAGAVVGEPTGMGVVVGHKGKIAGRIRCRGRESHSSLPGNGLNAIHLGADMVNILRDVQAELERSGFRDADFPVPWTTVHVGTISGGSALNIVPGACEIAFEIRSVPGDDGNAILADIRERASGLDRAARARFPDAGIAVEIENAYPGLASPPDAEIVRLATEIAGASRTGKVTFGTEAGLFQEKLGLPTVVCGPGDMDRAHKADEYITHNELAACNRFLDRLLDRLSG